MSPRVFGAHGHVFTVECEEPLLQAKADRALATLRIDAEPNGSYLIGQHPEGGLVVGFGGEEVGVRYTQDAALLLLHWHINQQVIGAATARRTTLHAAAARSPDGSGILLPAPMESGKTTTVTGLLRAGWDFLTDEAAAVDPDGTIWAYPKPLTVDSGSWGLFPDLEPEGVGSDAESWLVPATAVGSRVVEHASLRLVVFPAYASGSATTVRQLTPSQAALELAHSTFSFDEHGERDLRCVSALARHVPAYALSIGDLGAAVELINSLERETHTAA